MSNPFSAWSFSQVEAHNSRVRIKTAAALMAESKERDMKKKTAKLKAANGSFVLNPSQDEMKLNKTERAYLTHLRSLPSSAWIGIQNITLKLADDCRLTPDFAVLDRDGKLTLVDVKGFQREDAFIKMKVAARSFPMFGFEIVKRDGSGWSVENVRT